MKLISNQPLDYAEAGMSIIRIIVGLLLAYHGIEIFDAKAMSAYMDWDIFKNDIGMYLPYIGKGAELIAGLFLTFGLFTRLASIVVIGIMVYICFIIGKGQFWYGDQHPFLFILIACIYFLRGGGNWSLDNRFLK